MQIRKPADLKTAMNNKYTSNGSYPTFFLTINNRVLSFDAVKEDLETFQAALEDPDNAVGDELLYSQEVNWESNLYCDETGEPIESAYGISA